MCSFSCSSKLITIFCLWFNHSFSKRKTVTTNTQISLDYLHIANINYSELEMKTSAIPIISLIKHFFFFFFCLGGRGKDYSAETATALSRNNTSAKDQTLNTIYYDTLEFLIPICCSPHHPDKLLKINFSITCTFQNHHIQNQHLITNARKTKVNCHC